jgi:hypothetical protein
MTPNEKALIEDLFNRLRGVAPSTRDAEAEGAIAAEMARSPGAAYALVQTVLVQDHALREAHDKVQAAEAAAEQARQAAPQQQPEQPQSFLDRAGSALQGFGGQRNRPPLQQAQDAEPQQARQGGGFLQGALQTAAGVAGGALLFEGVRSMFGGGGGLLGGGASPFGGGGTTVNETIINESSDKGRDDDTREARDDKDRDDRDDDNVRNASYDSDDDDDGNDDADDSSFGSDDDSWV